MAKKRGPLLVLDVCTGSANLALAYAYYEPLATVYAADLSPEAVELGRRNVKFMGLDKRVEVRIGDLLEPFESAEFLGRCDFLSCNPPYISAAKVKEMHPEISRHEPEAAFNGGVYGVSILMKLLKNAPRLRGPGGGRGLEAGHGQGAGRARQRETIPPFAAGRHY